jgi:hypothetical protein
MSWSLHDLRGPGLCCQGGVYWPNVRDGGFECQGVSAIAKLSAIAKIHKYRGL